MVHSSTAVAEAAASIICAQLLGQGQAEDGRDALQFASAAIGSGGPQGLTRRLKRPVSHQIFLVLFRKHCAVSTVMILPQVHLRKPCYDFYFL